MGVAINDYKDKALDKVKIQGSCLGFVFMMLVLKLTQHGLEFQMILYSHRRRNVAPQFRFIGNQNS